VAKHNRVGRLGEQLVAERLAAFGEVEASDCADLRIGGIDVEVKAETYKQAREDLRELSEQLKRLKHQLIHKIDDLMQINYWLIFVAIGEVQHRYAGQCPDETNGYEGRDPDCPACQIIIEAEQAEGWTEHA